MKNFKFIFLITLSIVLGSCSSDDDSSPSSSSEYFNYKIAGETISVTQWEANRSENTIEVLGRGSNGKAIYFIFNAQGNIGRVETYSSTDFSVPDRNAQAYYTNESFNFNLASIDAANKTVKVTFSGKVYEDEYDLTSDFVQVEGDFQVKYNDVTPEVSGLGVYAKIAGEDWYSSNGDQSGGFFSGSDLTLDSYNGGVYRIGITINHSTTNTGTFNFTPSSTKNKVVLSKYNTALNYFEEFNCTGSLVITSKQVGAQMTIISGTYSFTAVDPETNASITVSNGTFKENYSKY